MNLAQQLLRLPNDVPLGYAIGVVTATSPLTIAMNGDTDNPIDTCPVNADYTPAVDDVVFVLRPGAAVFVLCKIA